MRGASNDKAAWCRFSCQLFGFKGHRELQICERLDKNKVPCLHEGWMRHCCNSRRVPCALWVTGSHYILPCRPQDQRNARALSAGHGRNPGGKLTVAEAAQFAQDWAVQGPGQGGEDDEDEGGLSASLLKSRRSKFTPKSRDTATVSVNDRNNLLFEGARPRPD